MVRVQEKAQLVNNEKSLSGSHGYGSIKYQPLHSQPREPRFLCTRRDTFIVTIIIVIALVAITTTISIGLPRIEEKRLKYLDTSFPISSSPLRVFDSAAVLSDGEKCASIGKNILQKNGSAVDAAIATLFCDGVVNPQSMGLGGGFFMIIYSKEHKKSEVIDARETAPAAATRDMFDGNDTLSQEGGLSVAVPGELKGYWLAHQRYGKLNWSELIEPSIKICEEGFPVGAHLADKLKRLEDKILSNPSMKEEFFNNETNSIYKEQEILKRPLLAETLQKIADKGAEILYTGELSQSFIKDIENCGGNVSLDDLKNYQPKIKPSVITSLRGESLHTVPPPGSGLILSFILNILDDYNISSSVMENIDSAVLTYHRMIEAFKFAFSYRIQMADPDFVNMTQLIENLKSKEFIESIRQQISDVETYPPEYYKPAAEVSVDHGTAQVSVLAPNGDAVSVTSTVNTYFGSLCRSPSTGIILNNAMDDFSSPNITNYFNVPPSPQNFIEPGKRPVSSMCPALVIDSSGNVNMVIGGAGGPQIITASAQTMLRVIRLKNDIKEATDAQRLHHQLYPNYVQYEEEFPKIYLDRLQKYGHEVKLQTENNAVFGIVRKNGKLESNVDFRKGGSVDGF